MTTDRMALLELVEKRADGDLVREVLAFAAERLPRPAAAGRTCGDGSIALRSMAAAVAGFCGAGHGERSQTRTNQRNGYRERSRAALSSGMTTGPSKAEPFWTDFPRSLADRGPRGVKSVVADDHKGLRAAASQVLHATQQRCRVNGMRKLLARVGAATGPLAHRAFAREHWPQIASTNPLERLNGEIKRRTNVVGRFPNLQAVTRLVGAILLEQNDEWAVARRYMMLATMRPSAGTELVSLPALVG
jgi:transposase-like protein